MSERLQDAMVRLLGEAHAAAQANDLENAVQRASAALDDWQAAGCPDRDDSTQHPSDELTNSNTEVEA